MIGRATSLLSLFHAFVAVAALPQKSGMYNALREQGYYEICNRLCDKKQYTQLYKAFDSFIELTLCDKSLLSVLAELEQSFLDDDTLSLRYCLAPPSYRNPKLHQKRHQKVYFQFIKEYYMNMLRVHKVLQHKEMSTFLEKMFQIDEMARVVFRRVIESLAHECLGLAEELYAGNKDLTVITKIVRYERSNKHAWGTTPHFDKSTLTLIWDSDDPDNDCLLVARNHAAQSIKELEKPLRQYSGRNDVTSALLIGGLALKRLNAKLKPTLHGVSKPIQEYRHAIISFALPPNTDMSDWQTDFLKS